MKIMVDQDMVAFTLIDKTRREKHIPTAAEQDHLARRQARRRAATDRGDWDLHSSIRYVTPWPEYDTIDTGQLAFLIEGWSHGLRKTWADGKTQCIETLVDAIVAGLKAILACDKERREERELRERQWAEEWVKVMRRHGG